MSIGNNQHGSRKREATLMEICEPVVKCWFTCHLPKALAHLASPALSSTVRLNFIEIYAMQ